jgi:hypothetical protein
MHPAVFGAGCTIKCQVHIQCMCAVDLCEYTRHDLPSRARVPFLFSLQHTINKHITYFSLVASCERAAAATARMGAQEQIDQRDGTQP